MRLKFGKQSLHGSFGICAGSRNGPFNKEVAPVFHHVVKRQIDKTNVFLFGRMNQVLTQVVDGWKRIVVIIFGKLNTVEERMRFRGSAVIHKQIRLIHSTEKVRIDLGNIRKHKAREVFECGDGGVRNAS